MGEFSDDDLDGLEEDDFLALDEVSAPPTQVLSLPLPSYTALNNGIDGHNHSGVISGVSGLISRNRIQRDGSSTISRPSHTITSQKHILPSSGPELNVAPGPSTQKELWRQGRYAATTPGLQRAATVGNVNLPHRGPAAIRSPTIHHETSRNEAHGGHEPSTELASLRAEVEAMRSEQERLRLAAKAAKDQMLAKSGEISILRSNQAKAQQDFERRLDDIQKKHMLENERHQADLDESRKERERLTSYNHFMAHERNDESWQLKQANISMNKVGTNTRPTRTTPRKQKINQFGDGFDDDEVMVVSPAKSFSKSRNTTPRGGVKRKRDALADSPMKQLELDQPPEYLQDNGLDIQPVIQSAYVAQSEKHPSNLQFLQQFLNRQLSRDEQRTYEVLSTCTMPSDPTRTLSTIITSEMASVPLGQTTENFPTSIGHIVASLWYKCLDEKYHLPIKYLIDLVEYILLEESQSVIASLVDDIVDLAQRTADVNVIPRYKRFKRKTVSDDPDNRPLDADISTKRCLELLDLSMSLCHRDQELVKRFWKSMRFDFISMLLRNSQDVEDVTLMVKILARSVRTDTFAMIVAPPASQSVSEQHVIDRLSAMLIEIPRVIEGEHQPDIMELSDMRLEILNLIEIMTSRAYCGEAFAKHPAALGRLVRVMHDELNALYEYRYGHERRAGLVNESTRLVYKFSQEYEDAVGNFQEKLRNPPTSVYKYLIALSRLAFSEGVVFEQDIDEDVLEMAHEMLELFTSPDEAEAIQKAFVRENSRVATAQV